MTRYRLSREWDDRPPEVIDTLDEIEEVWARVRELSPHYRWRITPVEEEDSDGMG